MTTFTKHSLLSLKDMFPALADIALDAVGKDPGDTLRELETYARRGVSCVLARDGGDLIGYALYGPINKILSSSAQLELSIALSRRGVRNAYTSAHLHLRKKDWKTGIHFEIIRAKSQDMLDIGVSHDIVWTANDTYREYAMTKPGTDVLQGVLDPRGKPIGVRDLAAYLAGTK